jgi:hypothetical protein
VVCASGVSTVWAAIGLGRGPSRAESDEATMATSRMDVSSFVGKLFEEHGHSVPVP